MRLQYVQALGTHDKIVLGDELSHGIRIEWLMHWTYVDESNLIDSWRQWKQCLNCSRQLVN